MDKPRKLKYLFKIFDMYDQYYNIIIYNILCIVTKRYSNYVLRIHYLIYRYERVTVPMVTNTHGPL